jgi:hypothetical protein
VAEEATGGKQASQREAAAIQREAQKETALEQTNSPRSS